MNTEQTLFDERQYLGLNRHSILRRTLAAVFCFTAYYWSENPKPVDTMLGELGEYPGNVHYGQLFFWLGLAVLVFSGIMLLILHMRTTVIPGALLIDGLWSARRVRIDLGGIVSARPLKLKPSFFTRPVYNLHTKGRIRFYTHGSEALELVTRDGLIYRIGTQRPEQLLNAIKPYLAK